MLFDWVAERECVELFLMASGIISVPLVGAQVPEYLQIVGLGHRAENASHLSKKRKTETRRVNKALEVI